MASGAQKFSAGVEPFVKYSTPEAAIKDMEARAKNDAGYYGYITPDKKDSAREKEINKIREKFAASAAAQEKFNQRMRKVDLTRSAVQRRAFFESEQATSGAMRSTTGMA